MIERDMAEALRTKLKQHFLPKNLENESVRKSAKNLLIQAARDRDYSNRLQRSEKAYRDMAEQVLIDYCATYTPSNGLGSRFGIGNKDI